MRRKRSPCRSRYWLVGIGLALVGAVLLGGACGLAGDGTGAVPESATPAPLAAASPEDTGQESVTEPTVDCTALTPTPAQTEGPYYKPGSPERTSLLEPGMAGTRLVITGFVVDSECRPIAGAWLDFWQADAGGRYDNSGYTLRGHQYTDERGRFTLETVVPGLYPGRTRHIHVKVQRPGGSVLTTQLYLPDEPGNSRDGIFRPELVLREVQQAGDGSLSATFTFVLTR